MRDRKHCRTGTDSPRTQDTTHGAALAVTSFVAHLVPTRFLVSQQSMLPKTDSNENIDTLNSLESLQPMVGLSHRVYIKVPQSPDPVAE